MNFTTLTDSTTADSTQVRKVAEIALYNMHNNILYIAVAMGITIILIGYFFAGGRRNKSAVIFSITVSTVIGIITLPFLFKLGAKLNIMDSPVGVTILIMIDFLFIGTVSALAYEIVTVTAREARPPE